MQIKELTQVQQQALFMAVMGSPTVATAGNAALELAAKLIQEEVNEEMLPALEKYKKHPTLENLVELFDGIIDSVYVIFQLSNALELPFDEGFKEVQRSNMDKAPGGIVRRREDGKVLKPEGWKPPNLWDILYKWETARLKYPPSI